MFNGWRRAFWAASGGIMRKFSAFLLLSAALAFAGLAAESAFAEGVLAETRRVSCLLVSDAAPSGSAGALYLERMGNLPEALKAFAPGRFSFEGKVFRFSVEGEFGYSSEGLRRVGSVGMMGLYEAQATIRALPAPKPEKTLRVTFRLESLSVSGGVAQPGLRAIELAARKSGLRSGRAWLVSLARKGEGEIVALVGLVSK